MSSLWIYTGLFYIIAISNGEPLHGTFNVSWYPEITSQIDMFEYLKGKAYMMTTARVSFARRREQVDVVDPVVGNTAVDKPYTLTQCMLDLFTRHEHQIQLRFANVSDLSRVVELLMLKDSPRIWIHLDLVPLPGTTTLLTTQLMFDLNQVLRWTNMFFSIGARPTETYSLANVLEMKRLTELRRATNMKTVFVLDGYVVQKQANFTQLVKSLILLERVSFLLRMQLDKEDKVVVADLNATIYGLGGNYRVYLDVSPRLRQIVLNPEPFWTRKTKSGNDSVFNQPCLQCQPMVVRKYMPCKSGGAQAAARREFDCVWFTLLALLIGVL